MILPGSFFHFFKVFIFQVVIGIKWQNGPKWQKILSRSISQEAYIWLYVLILMCTMITSPVALFISSKLWFLTLLGVKGQKMVQNDKKICWSHSVSHKPCIIWSWFLVHMCKMMISSFFWFCTNSEVLGF